MAPIKPRGGGEGNYGSVPTTIDQVGYTPEEYARKKGCRKLLFQSFGCLIFLSFIGISFWMMSGHVGISRNLVEESMADLDKMTDNGSVSSGCETTVMIVRHCEKSGAESYDVYGDQHCSYIGYQRASHFATLFGKGGWPIPSYIFALSEDRGGHRNFREIEMIIPLANKINLEIDSSCTNNAKVAKEIHQLIASGEACGKTIVVAWKHEFIARLARNLGCHSCPRNFPNVFDPVWQLKYVYDVKGTDLYQQINGDGINEGQRRHLKKRRNKSGKIWSLYFSDIIQSFDPLKYSNAVGDYDGNKVAANWAKDFIDEM